MSQVTTLLHDSAAPLPDQTGDGTYIPDDHTKGYFESLRHLELRDYFTIEEAARLQNDLAPWNDRQYLLEKMLKVLAPRSGGSNQSGSEE